MNDGYLTLRLDLKADLAHKLLAVMEKKEFPFYSKAIKYCIEHVADHLENEAKK